MRYAVIEKEALAATWACEKFTDYILGLQFTVETDHKPLVTLLANTDLSKMPPRILSFRLRMMRYSPKIIHVQGKDQTTADALSRALVCTPEISDDDFAEEVEIFALQAVSLVYDSISTDPDSSRSRCRMFFCDGTMQKRMASIYATGHSHAAILEK